MKTIWWAISLAGIVLIILLTTKFVRPSVSPNSSNDISNNQANVSPVVNNSVASPASLLTAPISNAKARITKKPFGVYITPKTSPVQPEKFTGYHTGVDFETLPSEQSIDVPIYAVCAGKLLVKERASGYGGVAVQACELQGQPVTIIYGHMRLASISAPVGQALTVGQQLGVLGTGYSQETDGERRHLHLGIHKGTAVNILGYVQQQSALSQWLNPADYL
jgi:hypothetical protein